SATLKGEATVFDQQQVTVGGGSGTPPTNAAERITTVGRDFMEGASPRFAAGLALREGDVSSAADRQDALLELLSAARAGSSTLAGIGFGPIRSTDGRAGILMYPLGTEVRTPGGAITPGTISGARVVIDVDALGRAIAGNQTIGGIFRFPDLTSPTF